MKSFALTPPAPWAPVTMSCRTSRTLTAAGETPGGRRAVRHDGAHRPEDALELLEAGGAPERMSVLPLADGGGEERRREARLRLAFHETFESEVAAAEPKASLGTSPGV